MMAWLKTKWGRRMLIGLPILLAIVVAVTLTVGQDLPFFAQDRSVNGSVVDATTQKPLDNAVIKFGESSIRVDEHGHYILENVKSNVTLIIEAPGYLPQNLRVGDGGNLIARLQPQEAEAKTLEVANQEESTITGKILDAVTNAPIPGALVTDGKNVVTTGEDGSYTIDNLVSNAQVKVRIDGYEHLTLDLTNGKPSEVKLRPRTVRALYLTHYGVGNEEIRDHAIQVIDETEANAVVIDIKGDRALMAYKSNVPLAEQIGANDDIQIQDIKALLDTLKQKDIYTIARIVTFKDTLLAEARPDLAVFDSRTGELWTDNEGLHWLDPFKEEVWDYNVALAVEAANYGFDEIQFDYVRFPTDAGAGTDLEATVFSGENLMANRVEAISGFLKKADEALKPTGAALAADIFGYVNWRVDDMGIGQHLETLGALVDYLCPMVYPTLFWDGIPRLDGGDAHENDAPAHPYDIVNLSMQNAVNRLQGARAKLRPWLQYYNDYVLDIPYGAAEVDIQKQATYDTGLNGWMMWDPSNQYIKGGFGTEE